MINKLKVKLGTVMAFALAVSCTETTQQGAHLTELIAIPDSVVIPVDQTRQMVANYAPRAGYVERDGEQLPNTRSIWMDLAVIEAFVAQLRANEASGIRFYLAAYYDDYAESYTSKHVPPTRHLGSNTLMVVPTPASIDEGVYPHFPTQLKLTTAH